MTASRELPFLVTGGQMGRLIAAHDWSATPVGPVPAWPAPLRASVGVMLESRHPMLIWWGPDCLVFYNDAFDNDAFSGDAFLERAGGSHPRALGAPGAETFPEIWPAIGPALQAVLDRGEASRFDEQLLLMTRDGRPEETYWTSSHSPIRDDDGRVLGVFTATSDMTARVVAERRVATLRALGDVAAVRLATADQVAVATVDALARNTLDLPFAAVYLAGGNGPPATDTAATDTAATDTAKAHPAETGTAETAAEAAAAGALRVAASYGLAAGPAPAAAGGAAADGTASDGTASDNPAPRLGAPDIPAPGGPVREAIRTGEAVVCIGLRESFPDAVPDARYTPGELQPDTAVVLPLTGPPGAGALVLGTSPYRPLDDDYREFLDLVQGRISAAVGDALTAEPPTDGAETVAEHDPAMGWMSDASGRFEHVSASWLVFTGAAATDLLGTGWHDRVHPGDLAAHLKRTGTARAARRSWESEYRLRRADGPYRLLLEHAVPVDEPGTGRVTGWVGSCVDITERNRRADEALFEERERYRTLVAQAPVGIWTADPAGSMTFVNDQVARMVGRPSGELVGVGWIGHVHPDDAPALTASWTAAVRAAMPWEREHRLVAVDGTVLDVTASARPLRGAGGALTGFLGTMVDVTEERRAEEVRTAAVAEHAARGASDAAAARLRAMVQGLAAIVWEADWDAAHRSLRFTFVSERAEELLGHPARRWRNDTGFWPAVIHPDDRAEALAFTAERTAAGLDHDLTYRAVAIDGRVVWLHQVVHVVNGRGGAPMRAQGLTVDVTQQKRGERAAEVLAETGRLVADGGTAEHRLAQLARLVATDLGDAAVVSTVGPDGLLRRVAVAVDPAVADPSVEQALLGLAPSHLPSSLVEALAPGQPVVVPVTDELNRAAAGDESDAAARRGLGASTSLLVPLVIGGRLVGLLIFVNLGPARYYDPTDLDLAAELGRRASLMLAADRQRRRERHMQQVSADLASAGTVAEASRLLVARLGDVLDAAAMSVYLVEPDRCLRLVHAVGYDPDTLDTFATIRFDDPVPLAGVVRTGEPVWLRNRDDWRRLWPDLLPRAVATDRHALAALPLTAGGRVVGTIGISFPTERLFPADEREFVLALIGQAAPAFERAATADERRMIAETLQTSLLPPTLPRLDRLALASRYLPGARGTQAGGDWYDVLPLADGLVAIAVGDVVGQGTSAAAIMGQLRSALSAYLLEGHEPAQALERLDRFAGRVPGAAGSTVACLVLDPATGELVWARAGHPPPLVTGPAGARLLEDATGTVLAVRGRPPYTTGTARIAPGESIVLYTDGIVERRGEVVDDGVARLAAVAARHQGLPPAALTDALLAGALPAGASGPGGAEPDPSDDIALIVARLVPAPLRIVVAAEATVLRELRAALLAWAGAVGLGDDDTYDLQLAVGEAAANAVEHAYRDTAPGTMAVELVRTADGAIDARVRDDGTWRPAPEDPGYRGRGLNLIRDVSSRMALDHGPGGTEVRFTLPAPPAARPHAPVAAPLDTPAGTVSLQVTGPRDAPHLAVRGDLDLAGVRVVREELLAAVHGTRDVATVDLLATTYLASAGIALLMELDRAVRSAGGRLRLVASTGGIVRRALTLSGVDTVLDVHGGPAGS